MEIQEKKLNGTSIIRVDGRLDSKTSPEFEEKISETIKNGTRNMILDFESLSYVSSAGLRIILKTAKELKRMEGKLVLCALQDYVREVFEISGFDSFLPIVPTVDDAMEKL